MTMSMQWDVILLAALVLETQLQPFNQEKLTACAKRKSKVFKLKTTQPFNHSIIKWLAGLAYGSGLHLLAFSEAGELYTWGYNTYSQLGNGNTNHTLSPSVIGGVLAGKIVIQVSDAIVFFYKLSWLSRSFTGRMWQSPLFSFDQRRRGVRVGTEQRRAVRIG